MPFAIDLSLSPLWRQRPAAERTAWARRCEPLIHVGPAPAPFAAASEAVLDLAQLAHETRDMDLVALQGITPSAVRARQLTTLAGRLCAEAALARQGERLQAPIDRDDAGGPLWPADWTGSITHAAGVAMAAVQRRGAGQDIGLDTEALITDPATLRAVLAQCLHASEHDAQGQAPAPERLTLVFSAKEAYYKAARRQVGRMIDFQEMTLTALDPAAGRFVLAPIAGPGSGLPVAQGSFRWDGARVVTRVAVARVDGCG
jgi:enterobactin synthetase component D